MLYGNHTCVCNKIAPRKMGVAGHCPRHPKLSANKGLLLEQTPEKGNQLGSLLKDACVSIKDELKPCMNIQEDKRGRKQARLRAA